MEFYRCWMNAGLSPASVWRMVEQVWHLSWTEKGNPCRHREERRDKGGGRDRIEVRPLRGNVLLRSSAPYTRTHSVCRCAGWCTHAKKDERLRIYHFKKTYSGCMCVSADAYVLLTCKFMFLYNRLRCLASSEKKSNFSRHCPAQNIDILHN